MKITDKFAEEFSLYKNYEERMGNKLKFIYNCENEEVTVYSEECDCYDGYDTCGSPYYFSYSDTWENVSILEFAELMEFYLEFKHSYDAYKIYCYFKIEKGDC